MNKAFGKKGLKLCTALMAVVLVFTGCGSKGSSDNSSKELSSIEGRYTIDPETPAWKLDKKEETTDLTWYVNADWWNTDFGKDLVTKKLKRI